MSKKIKILSMLVLQPAATWLAYLFGKGEKARNNQEMCSKVVDERSSDRESPF